jgi:hypothetical protein
MPGSIKGGYLGSADYIVTLPVDKGCTNTLAIVNPPGKGSDYLPWSLNKHGPPNN